MLDLQLWAFAPGGSEATILPRPIKVEASMVLSDVGSMTVTYPMTEPGHELLDGYCDVELRRLEDGDWICPPQGRFLVVDRQTDPVQESVMPTRTYTLVSWSWLTSGVLQSRTDILDSSGNREFVDMSPAEVVTTLIAEATTAGFCDTFTVDNQATTGGWAPSYAPGKAVSDILSESRDQGFLEWLMMPDADGCGRKLVLYDTVGTDLSAGDNPVTLRVGRDLVQAPSKVSMRDLAPSVLVAGDEQHYLELTNPGADLPYGFMQTYVSAAGVKDLGALEVVAQARLDKGATVRAELTRQVVFETAEWLPLRDYNLGDTVLAPDDQGQMAPLRVRQITLTFDGNRWGGNLVLGDRFSERTLALDRKVRQLTAPSVWGGGRNPATPAPPIMDNTTPPVSSALTATSKLGTVTLTWNGKDENGADVSAGFDHAEAERDTSGSFTSPVTVGTFGSRGKIDDAGLTIGTTYYYRLVIVNAAGVRAAGGAAVAVTAVGVKGPDLEANSVTANKMDVGELSAISADLGTIIAGEVNAIDINGSYITGSLFRTASSGKRLEISNTSGSGGAHGIGFVGSGNDGYLTFTDSSLTLRAPSTGVGNGTLTLSDSISLTGRGGASITVYGNAGGFSITDGSSYVNSSGINVSGTVSSGAVSTGSVSCSGDVSGGSVHAGPLYSSSTPSTSGSPAGIGTGGRIVIVSSSKRNKKRISNLKSPERVLDLRPVNYEYRAEGIRRIGVIAEEVAEVLPELVYLGDDGLPESVMYQSIGVMLIPLVRDLRARLEALEAQHAA